MTIHFPDPAPPPDYVAPQPAPLDFVQLALASETGGAFLSEVMAARREQVERHGHTAAADAAMPVAYFTAELLNRARGLHEGVQFNKGHDLARRRLVKLAALALALADRLDHPAQPERIP